MGLKPFRVWVKRTSAQRPLTRRARVPATFPLHKHEAWACTFFLVHLLTGPGLGLLLPIRLPSLVRVFRKYLFAVQSESVSRPAWVPDCVQDVSAETRLTVRDRVSATVVRDMRSTSL